MGAMTFRASPLLCGLALVGCFDTHAAPGAVDSGVEADAGTVVAPDGSVATEDAGTDGGRPPTDCDPVALGDVLGEPCFCNGPVALAGDVLYRRGIGIEVYDLAEPELPVPVREIEERSSSAGRLIVDASLRTLYSVTDIESGVYIYDIGAPLAPVLVGHLSVDGFVVDGALSGSTLILSAAEEESGLLHVADVGTPSAPRLERSLALSGRPGSIAADGRTAAVVIDTAIGESSVLVIDVDSGATLASLGLEGGGFGRALALDGDLLFVSGGGRALTVLRREGATLSVVGALDEDGAFSRALVRQGRSLLVGGDRLRVIDASDPARPVSLGEAAGPSGDIGGLAWSGDFAYVSGGNGVSVVSLRCE